MNEVLFFNSIQSFSHVQLFATPWTAACQASLSITISQILLRLMSIESVMPSNHLILCRPLLFPLSIFPSIRVFSNESVLHIRWPKYWSFGFSISPASEYSGLISWESESSVGLGKIKLMKFAWVMEVDVYSNLFYVVIRLKIRFPEERLLR